MAGCDHRQSGPEDHAAKRGGARVGVGVAQPSQGVAAAHKLAELLLDALPGLQIWLCRDDGFSQIVIWHCHRALQYQGKIAIAAAAAIVRQTIAGVAT